MEEILNNSKKNGLAHLMPNYNLWCDFHKSLETGNFIELNGIIYWTDEEYSKIVGLVNTKTHKKIEM